MPVFRISVHVLAPLIKPVLQSSRATPDLGCPDTLFLRHRKGRCLSSAGIVTTLLAQVRDRTGYSQSFCLSPSFSKYPSSQWKLLKRDSIKSGLCRLDIPFYFPFEAEEERKWKGVNIICSVWGVCVLLFLAF